MAKAARGATRRRYDADGRPFVRDAYEVETHAFAAITVSAVGTQTSEEVPCRDVKNCVFAFKLTSFVLGGAEELDIVVQTTYDGTNWVDVRNVHFADGDEATTYYIIILMALATAGAVVEGATLPTLGDDAANALPPGVAVRYKAIGTSTGPDAVVNCTVVMK